MSLYARNGIWWFKFQFDGVTHRRTTRSRNRLIAERAERAFRTKLEHGLNGLAERKRIPQFGEALTDFLEMKAAQWAPNTQRIEEANAIHLRPFFSRYLLTDITAELIGKYQQKRKDGGASHTTINLEFSTLRALLTRHKLWANLKPDVRVLRTEGDVGKALEPEQLEKLLTACEQ